MTANTPTVAAPPSNTDLVAQFLSTMSALSGVVTDYNTGSQIRTLLESVGNVAQQQSIWTNALAFQALMYSAMMIMGIAPYPPFQAFGEITIQTSPTSPFPINQNVPIASGTVVQTTGAVQFLTTTATTLVSGTSSVNIPVIASVGGLTGNVGAGTINQIVTALQYPLFVTNSLATSGGANAEQFSQTLARFSAAIAAVAASSPVAIANAAIGVIDSSTAEVVRYSTLYEPFAAAGSGAGSGTAGWTLYIDNGTGTASSGLVAAVISKLNGNGTSGSPGYRDAGVPYSVLPVTGTPAVVGVSGVVSSLTTTGIVSGLMMAAVSGYFTLAFGEAAQQALLAQAVGNSVLGLTTSLSVSLYASGGGAAVQSLTPAATGRVILGAVSLTLTSG